MSTLVNLLKSIVSFFLQVFFFVISLLMYIPGASTFRSAAITFMTEYRGWFVIFFVLPISLTFDLFFAIRARFIMAFFSAPELHEERVGFIQKQLRDWAAKNDGTKLCTRVQCILCKFRVNCVYIVQFTGGIGYTSWKFN